MGVLLEHGVCRGQDIALMGYNEKAMMDVENAGCAVLIACFED